MEKKEPKEIVPSLQDLQFDAALMGRAMDQIAKRMGGNQGSGCRR